MRPERIPLFPLNVVLLPGAILPLHIFEPRYRRMVRQCLEAKSEFGEAAFKAAVEKAKHYIYDGDIMQVVLAQRMSQPFPADPLSLYRALRSINPSPYMFYYDMSDHHVVGSSPEILVRLEDDVVTGRPIAGTRPRGKTREEDIALAEELLADPKEPESLISTLKTTQVDDLKKKGVIDKGMRPKVQSAIRALEEGVQRVHFIDGRLSHSLLLEIFTDKGIGTEIVHG